MANSAGEIEGQEDLAERLEYSALQWMIYAGRMQLAKQNEITDAVGDHAVVWRDRLKDPSSQQAARVEALALLDVCIEQERQFPDESGVSE